MNIQLVSHEMATLWSDFWFVGATIVTSLLFLFAVDDLFLDLVGLFRRIGPTLLAPADLLKLKNLPEQRIAILVANWQEHEILERMVKGNLENIEYRNYSIFLGVYPNDPQTYRVASYLESQYQNVFVIMNDREGPSSKGQLLNEMVRKVLASERATAVEYDLFLLQDSEDIIHPLALQLLSASSRGADFVQIPVFPLADHPQLNFITGTYMDDFAELHTKALLVRESLGAPIPSAGVGTILTKKLMRALVRAGDGNFLSDQSLTEDYMLGFIADGLGFRTSFCSKYFINAKGKAEFIATREYFPNTLKSAIRQKIRWTIGIAYQGTQYLGWRRSSWAESYFLWRDRRGPPSAALVLGAYLMLVIFTGCYLFTGGLPALAREPWFLSLSLANLIFMVWRLCVRMYAVGRVYGVTESMLTLLRWPVGNLIGICVALGAEVRFRKSEKSGRPIRWEKTTHRLPKDFGGAQSPAQRT